MVGKGPRNKVPPEIAAEVMFNSDRTCCVCREKETHIQIHHIDEDHSNNDINNLCVLCIDCHVQTQLKGGFVRTLDAATVKIYKNQWHETVSSKRHKEADIPGSTRIATFFPTIEVGVGNLPALGDVNAPVKIIRFSDFSSPFCGKFNFEMERQLRSDYVASGKVSLHFRDFPLAFHINSIPASIAARASAKSEMFWEMKDKLFETQKKWADEKDAMALFLQYATEIGLDPNLFSKNYNDNQNIESINLDLTEGQKIGVGGTPSIFIVIPKNRIPTYSLLRAISILDKQFGDGSFQPFESDDTYTITVRGAYPYSVFQQILANVQW